MRNYDYPAPNQGWIAKQMLAQVQADAAALERALRDDDRLPAWTLTKLATGTDRIGAAARYLLHKIGHPPSYGYGAADSGEVVAKLAHNVTQPPFLITLALAALGIGWMHNVLGGFEPEAAPRRARR